MPSHRVAILAALVLAATLGWGACLRAETLEEAMAAAYRHDPRLAAERARLRAADERLARAQSGYRPRISAAASIASQRLETEPDAPTDGSTRPRDYSIELTQPLFDGHRTRNAEREADAGILAARGELSRREQEVLLDVTAAFLGVVRDRKVLRLQEESLDNLNEVLRSTRARVAAGELTRTDIAQAESRVAAAEAGRAGAEAAVAESGAAFELVVGHAPGALEAPSGAGGLLPRSLALAIETALGTHPAIRAAAAGEAAARFAIRRIEAGLLPRVDLSASYSGTLDPNVLVERSETSLITGRLTVPLYEAGEISAEVREAKELRSVRAAELQRERLRVRAEVRTSWARLASARSQTESADARIKAAAVALEGVRSEAQIGARSLLDVLDAEEEVLEAKVAKARADFEVMAAGYQLLAAIGALSADGLGLAGARYDPDVHYEATDWRIMGAETPDEMHPASGESGWTASVEPEDEVLPWAASN